MTLTSILRRIWSYILEDVISQYIRMQKQTNDNLCKNIRSADMPQWLFLQLACTHLHLTWVLFQRPALYGTMAGLSCPGKSRLSTSSVFSRSCLVTSSVTSTKPCSTSQLYGQCVTWLGGNDRPCVAWPCWVLPWMAVIDGCNQLNLQSAVFPIPTLVLSK